MVSNVDCVRVDGFEAIGGGWALEVEGAGEGRFSGT